MSAVPKPEAYGGAGLEVTGRTRWFGWAVVLQDGQCTDQNGGWIEGREPSEIVGSRGSRTET